MIEHLQTYYALTARYRTYAAANPLVASLILGDELPALHAVCGSESLRRAITRFLVQNEREQKTCQLV